MALEIGAAEVRKIREARAWTQRDLARELGTDAVTVSRWERGVAHPRSAVRRHLAQLIIEAGPRVHTPFVEDPTTRIRRIESALRQMKELKRGAKRL